MFQSHKIVKIKNVNVNIYVTIPGTVATYTFIDAFQANEKYKSVRIDETRSLKFIITNSFPSPTLVRVLILLYQIFPP